MALRASRGGRAFLSPPSPKRAHIAVAVTVVVTVLAVVVWIFIVPSAGQFTSTPTPIVAHQPVTSNSLEQTRIWFSPWHSAAETTEPTRLVMLVGDGSLDVSSYSVGVSEAWQPTQLLDINASRQGDTVSLQSAEGSRVFTLHTDQPFLLENRPDRVYAVVATPNSENTFTVVSTTSEWAYAHGNRS